MRLFVAIVLLFFHLNVHSQHSANGCGVYADFPISSLDNLCGDPTQQLESHLEAEEMIEDILSKIGLTSNFLVAICDDIENAVAINIPSDIGYIRYVYLNPNFFETVKSDIDGNWGLFSLLSHEIGHHLIGHTLDSRGSRPEVELEADEFSGFMLYMLGASLPQAIELMKQHASGSATLTHPGKTERLLAIKRGYDNAKASLGKYKTANRNADYTTYAKQMFARAYQIKGNSEQDYINKVALYGKATEYRADYAEAWRNRAKFLNKLELYDRAREDANRAISLDRDNWNAYSEKAASYFGLKEYDRAIKLFSIPIEESGEERPYDYLGRGWAYYLTGSKVNAVADLEEALRLKPDLKEAREKLMKIR